MGATLIIFGHAWPPKQECDKDSENRQLFQHDSEIVPKARKQLYLSGFAAR
jgi:hypothetical protein